MPVTTYRIKISRGDTAFEAEGDKKFVLEMIERFAEEPTPVPPFAKGPKSRGKPGLIVPPTTSGGKKVSVGEFVRQLGFKKHTDLVLAFGYYLEKVAGAASFTPADINTCYYEAKLESSNTSQMIIQNIRRGFMMQAKRDKEKGKKAYTLTHSGEQYVEISPPKAAK